MHRYRAAVHWRITHQRGLGWKRWASWQICFCSRVSKKLSQFFWLFGFISDSQNHTSIKIVMFQTFILSIWLTVLTLFSLFDVWINSTLRLFCVKWSSSDSIFEVVPHNVWVARVIQLGLCYFKACYLFVSCNYLIIEWLIHKKKGRKFWVLNLADPKPFAADMSESRFILGCPVASSSAFQHLAALGSLKKDCTVLEICASLSLLLWHHKKSLSLFFSSSLQGSIPVSCNKALSFRETKEREGTRE